MLRCCASTEPKASNEQITTAAIRRNFIAVLLEYQNKSRKLLTDTALPALLGAVLAILTILAGMAGVGSRACRCGDAEWNLIEEKNRQHDLSQNNEQS